MQKLEFTIPFGNSVLKLIENPKVRGPLFVSELLFQFESRHWVHVFVLLPYSYEIPPCVSILYALGFQIHTFMQSSYN